MVKCVAETVVLVGYNNNVSVFLQSDVRHMFFEISN